MVGQLNTMQEEYDVAHTAHAQGQESVARVRGEIAATEGISRGGGISDGDFGRFGTTIS